MHEHTRTCTGIYIILMIVHSTIQNKEAKRRSLINARDAYGIYYGDKGKKEHLNYAKHKQGPPPSSLKAKANARAPAADLPQFPFLLNEKFVVCKGTRLLHFPPCGLCTFLQMMELRTYSWLLLPLPTRWWLYFSPMGLYVSYRFSIVFPMYTYYSCMLLLSHSNLIIMVKVINNGFIMH